MCDSRMGHSGECLQGKEAWPIKPLQTCGLVGIVNMEFLKYHMRVNQANIYKNTLKMKMLCKSKVLIIFALGS